MGRAVSGPAAGWRSQGGSRPALPHTGCAAGQVTPGVPGPTPAVLVTILHPVAIIKPPTVFNAIVAHGAAAVAVTGSGGAEARGKKQEHQSRVCRNSPQTAAGKTTTTRYTTTTMADTSMHASIHTNTHTRTTARPHGRTDAHQHTCVRRWTQGAKLLRRLALREGSGAWVGPVLVACQPRHCQGRTPHETCCRARHHPAMRRGSANTNTHTIMP